MVRAQSSLSLDSSFILTVVGRKKGSPLLFVHYGANTLLPNRTSLPCLLPIVQLCCAVGAASFLLLIKVALGFMRLCGRGGGKGQKFFLALWKRKRTRVDLEGEGSNGGESD